MTSGRLINIDACVGECVAAMLKLIGTEGYGSSSNSLRNRYVLTHDGHVQLSSTVRRGASLSQFFRASITHCHPHRHGGATIQNDPGP